MHCSAHSTLARGSSSSSSSSPRPCGHQIFAAPRHCPPCTHRSCRNGDTMSGHAAPVAARARNTCTHKHKARTRIHAHTHTHTHSHTHSHTRTHLRSEEHEANESSFRQSMSSVGSECSANCCTTVPRAASHTIAVCARARARDAAGHDVGVDARRPRRHARRRREQQQRVHARARTHLVNGAGQQIGARGVPPERENGPRVLRSAAAAGGHHH